MVHRAYIALGSNLNSRRGTPAETVHSAAEELRALGSVERVSSLYLTDPVGNRDQPSFVNAALSIETPLTAHELMAALLELERSFGRDRLTTLPKGPRTLDLDLLFFDDVIFASHQLNLPHPLLAERRFVLQPMAEIAPDLVHPSLGLKISDLLAALPDAGPNGIDRVNRIAE